MKTIGVIGLGGIGVNRLKLLAGMDSVRVGALSTRNEAVLADCAQQYGVEATFTDWRDLLADESLDAVCISTPNNVHAPMAEAAMEAGKDVLLEYPLAVTLDELDALIATAERTGRILHLGATTRHEPQHLAVRERLPELGEPVELRGVMALPYVWKWTRNQDVMGSYFSLANYHLVDQFIDWFGAPEWVSASLWQKESAGQITAISGSMFFGYPSGFSVHVNYPMAVPCQTTVIQFELLCENARITWHGEVLTRHALDGSSEEIALPPGDSCRLDTQQFVDELLDRAPRPDLTEMAIANRVCLLAEQSARSGHVTLKV